MFPMAACEDIDGFIEYFREQNREIATLEANPIFRKILYLIEIDSLSRAAFPGLNGNRKRIVKFIDDCSNWPDKDRVSAVQLKVYLKEEGIQSSQLCNFVNEHINSWDSGSPPTYKVFPTQDLTLQETEKRMTKQESRYVSKASYKELLYTYRNYLLHEFREPGNVRDPAIDLGSNCHTPYYRDTENSDPSSRGNSWELQFPVQFLCKLCADSINGLKEYLLKNGLNPYDSYKFGSNWASL